MNDQIIIGVAGMPGAGKTTVAEVAKRMHYDVVVMGDEVREETKKRKMEPTPDNVGAVMLELRQEEGPAVVAHRCIPKIEATRKRGVVIDGIRSPYETEAFKQHFPAFIVLALHSSPETRFKRLYKYLTRPEWVEAAVDRILRNRGSRTAGVDGMTRSAYLDEDERAQLVLSILEEI